MIAGLDSSFDRPTPATASAAYAAGVRVWGGYLASRDGLGLATRWSQADFAVVQNAGMNAIGFCSGYDDPDWIRTTAQAWGIVACVDVEGGIRPDGSWVMPWVLQAQAGLYGAMSVHYQTGEPTGRGAAFNVLALYPGFDPGATWFDASRMRPPGPCAWQWLGDHAEFGLSVDRSWFDDWFIRGVDDMALDPNDPVVQAIQGQLKVIGDLATATAQVVANGVSVGPGDLVQRIATLQKTITDAVAAAPAAGGLTAAQATALAEAHDAVIRIEQGLKGA